MDNYYKGAAVADIARLAALNDDLTCNQWHPRNARYRVPLTDAADEAMANAMADAIYGAVAEERAKDPIFNSDKVYQQCLADARRMLRDREYWGLFAPDEDFPPLLQ